MNTKLRAVPQPEIDSVIRLRVVRSWIAASDTEHAIVVATEDGALFRFVLDRDLVALMREGVPGWPSC